jgi:glucose-1-phosphate cytidylyltransferase
MNFQKTEMPPLIILCGGYGTRLREVTEQLPKPMVPVGPQPILWHIMKIYASYGVKRFILCLGYKRDVIVDYFVHYHAHASDITVTLGQREQVRYHRSYMDEDWEVTLANTGMDTQTGGRVYRAAKYLADTDQHFFLTYGDAVSDIDILALYQHHLLHGKSITLSAVHPAGRFGEISLGFGNTVKSFSEKPQTTDGYVNGGFMVIKREVIGSLLDDTDQPFEAYPMRQAAQKGDLCAYCHDGFWQCMDTPREHQLLNRLWMNDKAPWKVW